MARHFHLIFGLAIIGLTGCQMGTPSTSDKIDWFHYKNNKIGYSLDIPQKALTSWKGEIPASEEDMGFASYPIFSQPKIDDFFIKIRVPISSCSSKFIGATNLSSISSVNGNNLWGRVDFWDNYNIEVYGANPICEPFKVYNHESTIPANIKENVVYAFCSEKNGKTVLICVAQSTNDQLLAKEIFSSFRWLK